MTCEHVEDALLDYIEGQLEAHERDAVRSHIDACTECRRALRETKDLLDALHVAREQQERSSFGHALAATSPAPASATPAERWIGSRLGDFEILELIGRGGMGSVYRARQVSLNRIVALKVLSATLADAPGSLARFRREAQAAAKLHHTNIVPVYAQGEQDGHLYYAMELIEGVDLGRVLRSDPARLYSRPNDAHTPALAPTHAPGPPRTDAGAARGRSEYRKLARLIAQVADALNHAHRMGVLHRDIKPQNLLLGDDGLLHITDFGLARLLDEPGMTLSGEMLGTPAYMSPEQVDADRSAIDHRTDIWSLGVTLYELLTGRRPFDANSREQIIARIRHREPPPPRRLNPQIPTDLETICLRALEKSPARRYPSAGDMAADLLRYADDKPILSRRVGPIEKSIKWVRRHPALTTIISLALVLCVVVSLWINSRHQRANELVRRAYESLTYDDYRDPTAAKRWLARAESLGPDRGRFAVAHGMCWLLADPKRSIDAFNTALRHAPDSEEIMYLLAWACRLDQRLPDCERWLKAADAQGGPKSPEAHFFRGLALVRLEPNEAIRDFRRAADLNDNFYQAKLHLARALNYKLYHQRTLEDFGEIKRALGSACFLREKAAYPRYLFSIAHRIAGEIYRDIGEPRLAEENFAAALALALEAQQQEPESFRGYAAEAEYWESRGDIARALDARDRGAPRCNTRTLETELFEYRWRNCYWLGLHERTLSDLSALTRICPQTDPKRCWYAHFFPALVLADQGRRDEAAEMARAMAAEAPRDFRSVTSAASLLRVLGDAAGADALLDQHRDNIQFNETSPDERSAAWYAALYDYCRGTIDRNALDACLANEPSAVLESRGRLIHAEADFFDACRAMAEDRPQDALAALRRCENAFDFEDYCYLARAIRVKFDAASNPGARPILADEPAP